MKPTVILGGDERQRELFRLLSAEKITCAAAFEKEELHSLENLSSFGVFILPIPFSKDGKTVFSEGGKLELTLSSLEEKLQKNSVVIGGNFSDSFRSAAQEKGAVLFDLFGEKDFAVFNAYLTAQGAVRLLLENTKDYVVSRRALVTGFGKVGKATAVMLRSLGLDVYVFARRSEVRCEARAMGFKTLGKSELSPCVHLFDFVFNTVPAKLFEKQDVLHMKSGAVYFELASKPFGAEESDFEGSNAAFVLGSGLPGRFCPSSCAKEIFRRINKYFELQGDKLE